MFKIIVKQTPMGAFHWQLIDVRASEPVATSKDYETRADALASVEEFEGAWTTAPVNDLTPEGRKQANG